MVIVLAVAVAVWYTLQSGQKIGTSGPIKIGGAFGLTGDASAWGEASRNAAILAVDEINKNGGIRGRQIKLISEDTHSTSEGSVSVVSKLLNIDKVSAIIGPTWLDVYQGAAPLVKNTNVIMITPDAGVEAINGKVFNRNVFSTWYRSDVKAGFIVKHMAEHSVKRLFIVFQNDSYYGDFADRMKKYAQEFNVEVVGTELVNSGMKDLRTVALKAKALNPDAIMLGLYDEGALLNFLQVHYQIMPNASLYGDEIVIDFVGKEGYKELLNGVKFFNAIDPTATFRGVYKNKYGVDPTFSAGTAYDTTMIIAKALTDKGVGADLNDYLRSTTFHTVSFGDMMFDKLGGVQTGNNQFVLKILQNGVVKEIPW